MSVVRSLASGSTGGAAERVREDPISIVLVVAGAALAASAVNGAKLPMRRVAAVTVERSVFWTASMEGRLWLSFSLLLLLLLDKFKATLRVSATAGGCDGAKAELVARTVRRQRDESRMVWLLVVGSERKSIAVSIVGRRPMMWRVGGRGSSL